MSRSFRRHVSPGVCALYRWSKKSALKNRTRGGCGYQSLFPRLCRLLITIILQDHPGSSRQTLRCFLIVDPRACGCAYNPPRCVSTLTPPSEEEKTREGMCYALIVYGMCSTGVGGSKTVVCQSDMASLLGETALFSPGSECNSPVAPSDLDRLI